MSRLLLTGGTGLIGQALCRQWKTQGHEVIVLSRRPHKVASLCHGSRGIAKLQELDREAPLDAVINLAGAPIADRPWTAARRRQLWSSRVDLTHDLVDWIGQQATPARTLISGSAVGWYGDGLDDNLDESSPPGGKDFGSKLCVAWEQEADRADALGLRVVVLRIAPVLAPKGGMLARLRLPFSLGLGGRLGNGQQWMPWIHLDDIVGLIDFMLHNEYCRGPYNACAPEQLRNAAFTQALASALRRPAFMHAPAWVLQKLLGEMSVLLLGGQRVMPQRAQQAGYTFLYPDLKSAFANLIN